MDFSTGGRSGGSVRGPGGGWIRLHRSGAQLPSDLAEGAVLAEGILSGHLGQSWLFQAVHSTTYPRAATFAALPLLLLLLGGLLFAVLAVVVLAAG